jgi:hypothetical protein
MRSIAQLLFGPDGDRLLDELTSESGERRMTTRVSEAGDWCQTTPGADALRWVGPPSAHRRPAPRRGRGRG